MKITPVMTFQKLICIFMEVLFWPSPNFPLTKHETIALFISCWYLFLKFLKTSQIAQSQSQRKIKTLQYTRLIWLTDKESSVTPP